MGLELVENADDQPGPGSAAHKPVMFEITVNGKKESFDLSNPDQVESLRTRAQMGTNYSQRVADVNKREAKLQETYQPYVDFDRALQQDPELSALVTARLRGDPLPLERFGVKPAPAKGAGDEDGDDRPNVAEIETRLRKESDAKVGRVASILERMEGRLNQRDQQDAEREDVAKIKSHPVWKGWVREDHITLAKEAQRTRGGSVYANFLLLFEHEIPKIIESRVMDEIPADLRRTALTRETAPLVIDGMALTEETLAAIRSDPNKYALYKKAIRAHKRKITGKLEYPR